MALNAGEVFSGGRLIDADGRRVVILEVSAGSEQGTAGNIVDANGRRVVVLEHIGGS